MMLGPVLIATKGNGAEEVGAVYKRALELGRQVGQDAQLFPVLFGLRSFHLIRAELHPAFDLAQQLTSVAESVQDSGLLVEAHLAQGNSLFLFGKFIPALAHTERALALYDPQKHHVHAFLYGLDPGVFCLGRIAWLLTFLGHLDRAAKKNEEALALAHQQPHAFSSAVALMQVCVVQGLRGEWAALQQTSEAAAAICTERGFGSKGGIHFTQVTPRYRCFGPWQTDRQLRRGGTTQGISTCSRGFSPTRRRAVSTSLDSAGPMGSFARVAAPRQELG